MEAIEENLGNLIAQRKQVKLELSELEDVLLQREELLNKIDGAIEFANTLKEEPKDYKVYKKNEDIEPKIIIKEVPVEKIVEKEVIKEVPVEKIVEKEVIKEVPVEKIVERIIEVEKPPKPQETSMYKPATTPETPKSKPNNPWGPPGGSRT